MEKILSISLKLNFTPNTVLRAVMGKARNLFVVRIPLFFAKPGATAERSTGL